MLWQIDDFGELTPPDQDTLSSSEDQIPGGRHGGIFEVQAIRAKLPLANAGIDSMPATVVAAFLFVSSGSRPSAFICGLTKKCFGYV